MKRLAVAFVGVSVLVLAGCQRQAAPERAPEATPAAGAEEAGGPAATAPGREAAPRREARPAPGAEAPEAPARASAPESSAPAARTPAPRPPALAAGTKLPIVLQTTVASNTAHVGDRVLAEVAEDVAEQGRVVLPQGTEIVGRVTAAEGSGRVKGRARLAVAFQEMRVGGASYVLDATPLDVTAASSKGRDAKILGGAAAAGAIIGAIADGGSGALKGGAIGGAAGGAAVLATKGKEVVFKTGERYSIELKNRLQVD
jgi:hypothetical protein